MSSSAKLPGEAWRGEDLREGEKEERICKRRWVDLPKVPSWEGALQQELSPIALEWATRLHHATCTRGEWKSCGLSCHLQESPGSLGLISRKRSQKRVYWGVCKQALLAGRWFAFLLTPPHLVPKVENSNKQLQEEGETSRINNRKCAKSGASPNVKFAGACSNFCERDPQDVRGCALL